MLRRLQKHQEWERHGPCWAVAPKGWEKTPNHTSLNENYVVPCICLRAIWHMHGSMWRATRKTRDRERIIVAHCVIALWRHYYYALAKFYCGGRVEGHFSGYPSHKTYISKLWDTNLCTSLVAWLGCTIASLYETYCWNRREDTVCRGGPMFSSRLPGQGVCVRLSGWLTLRRLMSYIYGAPILDVSRSHTTTQHSR